MRIWDVNDIENHRFLINLDSIAYVRKNTNILWYTDIHMNDGNAITLEMTIDDVLEALRRM